VVIEATITYYVSSIEREYFGSPLDGFSKGAFLMMDAIRSNSSFLSSLFCILQLAFIDINGYKSSNLKKWTYFQYNPGDLKLIG
jgi:hypothetical protein